MNSKQIQLTNSHIKIYKYIKKYISINHISPTYREIAAENNISLSYCHKLVKDLDRLEYLKCFSKRCRGIWVR